MATKAIDSKANSLAADKQATLYKQIFHIGRAQRKSTIGPDHVGNNLSREKLVGNFIVG